MPAPLTRTQEAPSLAPRRGLEPVPGIWVVPETSWSGWLSVEEMRRMGVVCPAKSVRRSEVIYRKGDPADSLFVVLEGHVKITLPTPAGERVLGVVGPDDLFGESFLTLTRQRQSEAVCLSSSALICPISRRQFLEAVHRVPGLMLALATVLAERNRSLEEELRQATQPAEARLARVLLTLAERFGTEVAAGVIEVNLELRQEELGSLAGTTRVNTTQTLSAWRELGLVEGTRGRYRVWADRLRGRVGQLELPRP